jgi:energy-converting hydrogenase Eha subunit G
MHQLEPGRRIIDVNLYIAAVSANLLALAILVYGVFVHHFTDGEKALAIGLTALSVIAWGFHVGRQKR